jgi:hypothetical protein
MTASNLIIKPLPKITKYGWYISTTSKVRVSVLALSRSAKDTGRDIFATGLIGFPPKPNNGYYGGCNMC